MSFSITVYGKPEPAGSKRAFINPKTKRAIITDDNRKAKPWKQEVAGVALGLTGGKPIQLFGPLSLTAKFILRRPKSHYGTGRNSATLKPTAPTHPTGKPDTTKLLRGAEDALTGIWWGDDAQIVLQVASKCYGEPERCELTVEQMRESA